ncbi:hypothetical protein BTN50_0133 [Candidatus Enterovibrio altilux]|uniref:Mobile element protein n=1 Tax=Candidatus Enterovibrio altilux TaxID=1927128 RepID=A0A291B6R6_9GAMM|nr:hypothetical protein BTN50_0133 [Candidatus Enterovibrio luxaltus]
MQLWHQTEQDNHGRPRLFRDLAMIASFMVKCIFEMTLRDL